MISISYYYFLAKDREYKLMLQLNKLLQIIC